MHSALPFAYASRHLYSHNQDPYRPRRAEPLRSAGVAGARRPSCCRDARVPRCSTGAPPRTVSRRPPQVASCGGCGTC